MQLGPGRIVGVLPEPVTRPKIDDDFVFPRGIPITEDNVFGGQAMQECPRRIVAEYPQSVQWAEINH